MKHKLDIKSLVLGAFLGGTIIFSVAAVTSGGSSKWEHKIISGRLGKNATVPLAQQLDKATAEGWEVVSAASDDGYPFLILRRPK